MTEDEIGLNEIINHKYFWPAVITIIYLLTRLPLLSIYETLWWDEAQYALMTKHLFTNSPTTGWWEGRSIIYPAIMWLVTMPFGYNELLIKFVNVMLGLGFVISSYYLIKKLFNQKYAVMTGLIMSTQWVFWYWSLRITIGVMSGFLLTLSALLFIKKKRLISGLLLGLAFTTRFTAGITGLVYLTYGLLQREKQLKNYYWLIGLIIGVMPLFIYDLIIYGNPLHSMMAFLQFNLSTTGGSQAGTQAYYFNTMMVNYGLLMGLIIFIGMIPLIIKIKKKPIQFTALNVIIYLGFYSLITSVKEARFLIHLLPFLTITALLGGSLIINTLTKHKKAILYGLTIITLIIMIENTVIALDSIERVKTSYNDVRLAGQYLSDKEGPIMSNSVPQITYYSNKETNAWPGTYEEFKTIMNNHSYLIISAYEQHPAYAYQLNETNLKPIKAYPNPQNALLLIYQVQ